MSHRSASRAAALVLAAVLVVAACGSGDDTAGGGDGCAPATTSAVSGLPGADRDVLEVGTTDDSGDVEAVDVITDHVGSGAIGLHIHDDAATPGTSTLGPLPYFSTQPFQAGIDLFMPGADGIISVTNVPRGDTDRPQTLNVPNWASSGHSISLMFADYPVN